MCIFSKIMTSEYPSRVIMCINWSMQRTSYLRVETLKFSSWIFNGHFAIVNNIYLRDAIVFNQYHTILLLINQLTLSSEPILGNFMTTALAKKFSAITDTESWRHNSQDSAQGRIYSCGGPGATKVWSSLSVTTNLIPDNSFLHISYNNWKYQLDFHYFREANIAIKLVDFVPDLW
jgi:hypothetical protein